MRIINGKIVNPNEEIVVANIYIDDATGLISDEDNGGEVVDANGCYITPGFIDTHIHGCFGSDTSDCSVDAINNMSKRLPEFGVAAFCPTTMTTTVDVINKAFDSVSKANPIGAKLLGIHLEGPFMSPAMGGVQTPDLCIPPCKAQSIIDELESSYPGLMRIIDVAPELDGGIELIRNNSQRYVMSLAHTEAGYDVACEAFDNGACSVTHILNAMTSFGKRFPGVPGAAFDKNAYVEIICDGYHIEPSMLRMLFAMYDEGKIIIVSDAMRGAGMPDGEYYLADTKVTVKGGRTYFGPNGNLAGSVTNIAQEVSRLISFGVPVSKVIKAATLNPLARLGIDSAELGLGRVDIGYKGFVNVWDKDWNLIKVINGSQVIKPCHID